MQPDPDPGMPKERLDKRTVAFLVSLFEDVVEVADGLVRVNHKRQFNLVQQATSANCKAATSRRNSLRLIQLG